MGDWYGDVVCVARVACTATPLAFESTCFSAASMLFFGCAVNPAYISLASSERIYILVAYCHMDDYTIEEDLLPVAGAADAGTGVVPPKPVPTSVKVLLCALLFGSGLAFGSTGHELYAALSYLDAAEFTAAGALVGNVNTSANPCDSLWSYSCATYEAQHLTGSGASTLQDMQDERVAVAVALYEAHIATAPLDAASVFYVKCRTWTGSTNGCDTFFAAYANTSSMDTLLRLWESGLTHSGLGVGREPSPFTIGKREMVVYADGYLSGDTHAPTEVKRDTDPCNLLELYTLLFCSGAQAQRVECMQPVIFVLGDVDSVCSAWTAVRSQPDKFASAARAEAVAWCERIVSDAVWTRSGCFLQTAELWPEPSVVYHDGVKTDYDAVQQIWRDVKVNMLSVASPLGSKIAAKINAVELRSGYSRKNLSPGPPLAILQGSIATIIMECRRWVALRSINLLVQATPAFHINSFAINAYFSPAELTVYLPTAFMASTSPFAGVTQAQLGFILAHELAHSIDPSSIGQSADGLYVGIDAQLHGAELDRYNRFVQCVDRSHENQLAEDFADVLGAKVTSMLPYTHKLPVLPIADFSWTAAQLRTVAVAQLWCGARQEPSDVLDAHSSPLVRVNGAIASMTASFGCHATQKCAF